MALDYVCRTDKKTVLIKTACFEPRLTLDCGQAFRWVETGKNKLRGVAFSRPLAIEKAEDGIKLIGTDEEDFESVWKNYFDLERDYDAILDRFKADRRLEEAIDACYGIRILRQEPWETLCSFIISQNNNIPRIKGIIDRLCRLLGKPLGDGDYAFPAPETVAEAGKSGLAPIRAGFRAEYIADAAEKVAGGETDFKKIRASDPEEGEKELMKIKGVGPKVARCVLLYGFGKSDVFPEDVWIKRVMKEIYPDGLPGCVEGARGIAQQYLFHWIRNGRRKT